MFRAVRLVAPTASCIVLLAGCGTPQPAPTVTSPVPNHTFSGTAGSPTPAATPSQAGLMRVEALLYPATPPGGDCLSLNQGPPSALPCPVTRRLAATISAILADPGGAADPVCGCQAIDAHQTATYSPGTPAGGGRIHITAFGAPRVDYVVVMAGGQLLVDDIIYCSPTPHSIYTAETVASC